VTSSPPGLDAGLDAVAEFLGPDGARVHVEGWEPDAGHLRLRLELESAGCAECVLPRPMLDRMLLTTLREHAPAVRTLHVDDPRESG
jgi:hypothetical protein